MTEKLEPLPCPFCGSVPEIWPWHGGAKTTRMVLCRGDYCWASPMVLGRTRKIAVQKWNTRHD